MGLGSASCVARLCCCNWYQCNHSRFGAWILCQENATCRPEFILCAAPGSNLRPYNNKHLEALEKSHHSIELCYMTEASALECSVAPALFANSRLRFAKKEVLGCRWDVRDLAAHAVECKAGAPVIRILSSFESSSGRRRFSLMQCCATCFREHFGRGKKGHFVIS